MEVVVRVTEEHIRIGRKGDCSECPIALAVQPHIRDGIEVKIFNFHCNFTRGGEWLDSVELPAFARQFYVAFDRGKYTGQPFSFRLDIPDQFLAKRTKKCAATV